MGEQAYGPWFEQYRTDGVIPQLGVPTDKEFDILVLDPKGDLEDILLVYIALELTKREAAMERMQRRETDFAGGLIILANEEVVARHQSGLEKRGIVFLPNWRETGTYRDMLRHALDNGEIYLMTHGELPSGREGWFPKGVTPEDVEIVDYDGRIDIKPRG